MTWAWNPRPWAQEPTFPRFGEPAPPLNASFPDYTSIKDLPFLGVCLGHQSIGAAFGGKIIKAPEIIHGKLSKISHSQEGIFNGIDSPYLVVRYHSLVIEKDSLPNELEITAVLEENPDVIMAIEHKDKPIYGVQFHPESIETGHGMKLIKNFLEL